MAVTDFGVSQFWVGGYGAFDSVASAAVMQLKKNFPHIKLYLILAYMPKEGAAVPNFYDGTVYPEGLELVPRRFAISRRNQWMVNNCDLVIGYVDAGFGGAYAACRMAARKEKLLFNIGTLDFS